MFNHYQRLCVMLCGKESPPWRPLIPVMVLALYLSGVREVTELRKNLKFAEII